MRQLLEAYEACNDSGGFDYLVVSWKENGKHYVATHNKDMITDDELLHLEGKLVIKSHIYSPWRVTITEAPSPLPEGAFVKRPRGICEYDGAPPYIAEFASSEVDVMEIILKSPQRNICTYYGCIRQEDYVDGIVLKKYPATLAELIRSHASNEFETHLDVEKIIAGVRLGIDHLHSLGLVHDDINPHNIMIDADGEPVIIDFDSCRAPGRDSRGGTPGWSKNPEVVAFENDEYGFRLVKLFLIGEYKGDNMEFDGF